MATVNCLICSRRVGDKTTSSSGQRGLFSLVAATKRRWCVSAGISGLAFRYVSIWLAEPLSVEVPCCRVCEVHLA